MRKKTLAFLGNERMRADEQAKAMGTTTRNVLNSKIASPAVKARTEQKTKKYEGPLQLA